MPASFITFPGNDLFGSGGSASHLVKIPAVDGVIGKAGLAIYDTVTFKFNDTIQYFLTFDDVIKYIFFGKGVGDIGVSGTLYCNQSGDLPGLNQLGGAIAKLRGKDVKLQLGSITVTAVLTSAEVSASSESLDTTGHFNFNFAMIDHSL